MEHLSLFARLRAMEEAKMIRVRSNPDYHLPGEGEYFYGDDKVDIISDHVGLAPDGSKFRYEYPHDIAWVPAQKLILASAKSESYPFVPLKDRPVFRDMTVGIGK